MPLESTQHPNNNNSFFFAIAIALFFIVCQLGARFIYPGLNLFSDESYLQWNCASLAIAVFATVVNLKNTFATNDDWKTYVGILSIGVSLLTAWVFISQGLN